MESFNRGEHVVADCLDVEKAFDNVWHNGLRYKIQVNMNGFLSDKVSPIGGVPQGSILSPLLS